MYCGLFRSDPYPPSAIRYLLLPDRSLLDRLDVAGALEDALYENSRRVNLIGIQLAGLDQFFHLGGSVKDAADRCIFTLSRQEPTQANLQRVDDLINKTTELFGPSNLAHP